MLSNVILTAHSIILFLYSFVVGYNFARTIWCVEEQKSQHTDKTVRCAWNPRNALDSANKAF